MKHFLLFFIILFAGSFAGRATPTIIAGRFAKKPPKAVILQYYATIEDRIESHYTKLQQDLKEGADFRFVVETERPIELQMLADEDWLFYDKFLLPGDSLHIIFNGANMSISGNSEAYMGFQFSYDERFNNKDSAAVYEEARTAPDAISFAARRNKILQSRLQFFKDYFKEKGKAPEMFGKIYRANEELRFLVDMVQLSWRAPIGQNALYDSAYRNYMKDIDFNDPAYSLSSYYTNFLRELPYGLWSTMKGRADKDRTGDFFRNQYLIRDSIARVYFKDKAYDYAVYSLLQEQVKTLSKQVGQPGFDSGYRTTDSVMRILGRRISDKELYAKAARQLISLKEARAPAADFSARDLHGNTVKLSDYKGKVVYLDVWSTSCVPCLGEIPYAKKMQERYKANPDIVLLYLSFDRDSTLLSKFLKDRSFTGIHWVDHKGFASEAANRYHITSLPYYIMIDKKGMLVTTTAPRPSEDPYTLLDQLLKE